MTTWGNDAGELGARRRQASEDTDRGAWSRLWIGLGAALVMLLAYPFYEYTVHAKLAERDLREATRQMQAQIQAAGDAMARDTAERQQLTIEQRLAAVRVKGVSDAAGGPVVMVELQGLTAAQAAVPICAQAAGWLKRSVGGEVLRVQAARGQRPAQDAGTIRCE